MRDFLRKAPEVLSIRTEIEGLEGFRKEVEGLGSKASGWTKFKESLHEKVYYRQEKGGKYHSTYTETRARAPLMDVLLVLCDVSNYK